MAKPKSPEDCTMTEDELVAKLRAAHKEARLVTVQLAEVRERRRELVALLIARDRGPSWIARVLGVSPQAVVSLLRYKERRLVVSSEDSKES